MNNFYTTIQGDTWDSISLKVYGDEKYMYKLIDNNHKYNAFVIFPANIKLEIPELIKNEKIIFPPWRKTV